MSHDPSNRPGATSTAQQTVDQCLRMVMALNSSDLRDPQIRTGLSALVETIQNLLSIREQPVEPPVAESIEEDESFARPAGAWRSRVKTNAEKQEKKARLEKREAILRDLRSRVSQFKSDNEDLNFSETESVESYFKSETYEARRQRASFWPDGSQEWARQLLGIELAMSPEEKRQRYLQMVKLCHPDHNQNISTEAIQQVNAAWLLVRS